MTLSHWLIYNLSQQLVAAILSQTCTHAATTLLSLILLLRCVAPVWIRATHCSDKIVVATGLSQECTMSHEATCRSNMSQRGVALTCRLVCPNLNCPRQAKFESCSSFPLFTTPPSSLNQQNQLGQRTLGKWNERQAYQTHRRLTPSQDVLPKHLIMAWRWLCQHELL